MKKTLFILTAFVAFLGIKSYGLTPEEAFRQICNLPTMQETMPTTQFTFGSKMVFINAQTARSVAYQPAEVQAIAEDVGEIIAKIPDQYFVASGSENGRTLIYYAQQRNKELYDVLCIETSAPSGYCQATYSQAPASTIRELKNAEMVVSSSRLSISSEGDSWNDNVQ